MAKRMKPVRAWALRELHNPDCPYPKVHHHTCTCRGAAGDR